MAGSTAFNRNDRREKGGGCLLLPQGSFARSLTSDFIVPIQILIDMKKFFSSLLSQLRGSARVHLYASNENENEDDERYEEVVEIEKAPPKHHKLQPTVLWLPEPGEYPNPLGDGQLNPLCFFYRKVQLPGTFIFNPPKGTGNLCFHFALL